MDGVVGKVADLQVDKDSTVSELFKMLNKQRCKKLRTSRPFSNFEGSDAEGSASAEG